MRRTGEPFVQQHARLRETVHHVVVVRPRRPRQTVAVRVPFRAAVLLVLAVSVQNLHGVDQIGEQTDHRDVVILPERVRVDDRAALGTDVFQVVDERQAVDERMIREPVLVQPVGQEIVAFGGVLPPEKHLHADFVAVFLRGAVARGEELDAFPPRQIARHRAVAVEEMVRDDDAVVAARVISLGDLAAGGFGALAPFRGVDVRIVTVKSCFAHIELNSFFMTAAGAETPRPRRTAAGS